NGAPAGDAAAPPGAASSGSLPEGGADVVIVPDGTIPDDAALPDGGCAVPGPTAAGATAVHMTKAPKIDGKIGDWPCTSFTSFNATNAGKERGTPTATTSGQYAFGWDGTGLYFVCIDFDPNPESTNVSGRPYED